MTLDMPVAEIDVEQIEDMRAPFPKDKKPVAVILTNYNMPERADAIVEYLMKSAWPFELFLVDNGSDLKPPAKWTSVRLDRNIQTTNGWLAGVGAAQTTGIDYLAYVFAITSAEFVEGKTGDPGSGDPLSSMAQFLVEEPNAVAIHPALTPDSTTHWEHMKTRDDESHRNTYHGPRQTWMIDNIFSMYRRDWFDANQPFDPRLTFGWGIDLEACFLARKQGRSIWIDEMSQVKKVTDIGYQMNRMRMTADQRRERAAAQMHQVLTLKHGPNWRYLMENEGVKEEWK